MSARDRDAGSLPVRVHRLGRGFQERWVLDDVTFEVRPGERFCLIGSNGAGKSTLMAVLAGIRQPHRGEVTLFGRLPGDPALKGRRGIQLERPYFPYYARVREMVWLFARMHPHGADPAGLLEGSRLRGDAYIRHLSKGQRQRLALALATIGDPELLILDEPTSGLDPEAKGALWRAVDRHLAGGAGRALLFTTHELAEAEDGADRVAVLHRGRIAAEGTPDELRRAWVGAERKLAVTAPDAEAATQVAALVPAHLVAGVRRDGREVTVYTDHPREILERLPIEDAIQVHVRHVSLEDVFLRVTAADSSPMEAAHAIAAA